MALLLSIETSTKNCSVALSKEGTILSLKEENNGGYSHAEQLHVFIEEILQEHHLKVNNLDAIAVGKGPGSYTGLRIGVSTAKGLAYAANIPLIAIDTLKALAKKAPVTSQDLIVPMIDARRLEVYTAIYNANLGEVQKVNALIVEPTSFEAELQSKNLYFLGDGAEKCKEIIQHPNANFIDNIFPSAKEIATLAEEKYQQQLFEDVAYFEPFYLKDFIVTPQKKKVFK